MDDSPKGRSAATEARPQPRYLSSPRPRLFAHRGGSLIAPENTLLSFREGLEAGATHLELDVHATADGHVVVLHDETVDRTTDGSGLVRQLSLAALKALDAGARFEPREGGSPMRGAGITVPTLSEVLEAFPDALFNIEIKQREPEIEQAVLDLLASHDALDRTLLAAEDPTIMGRIRGLAPAMLTGFSAFDAIEFLQRIDDPSYRPPGNALQVPPSFGDLVIVTPAFVARAHALGLEVHVWTLDTEPEILEQLALGVDGVMTDDPRMAAAALRAPR
jgi:glycerophosphoryl diester phosphodiesterase